MSGWAELPPILHRHLGVVDFERVLWAQRSHREAMIADLLVPEVLWTVEHPSVITTGLRSPEGLPSAQELRERGCALARTERGGLATWHGPGQIVAYALLRLRPRGLSVPALVAGLEHGMAAFLQTQGVRAERVPGRPGLFVGQAKIASVGVHIRRGVSLHGCALNLDCDLDPFGWFAPCGQAGAPVTSLFAEAGRAPTPSDAASTLADTLLWSLFEASSASRVDTLQRSR